MLTLKIMLIGELQSSESSVFPFKETQDLEIIAYKTYQFGDICIIKGFFFLWKGSMQSSFK